MFNIITRFFSTTATQTKTTFEQLMEIAIPIAIEYVLVAANDGMFKTGLQKRKFVAGAVQDELEGSDLIKELRPDTTVNEKSDLIEAAVRIAYQVAKETKKI